MIFLGLIFQLPSNLLGRPLKAWHTLNKFWQDFRHWFLLANATALKRELQEEIGITIEDCDAWKTEQIDYPHALVQLNFCKVTRWSGELQMREAQFYAWQQLPVTVKPVLPGTLPVLEWFAKERSFVSSTVAE